MYKEILILAGYALLGAGIKYIDQAYDLGIFSKRTANIIAIFSGLLMGSLIISDTTSATIFLGMFIALAVTHKIDNIAFYIGTAIILLMPFLFYNIMKIEWLPFGIIIFSGISDEVGNTWADKRVKIKFVKEAIGKIYPKDKFQYRFAERFFMHRFAMKVAILFLAVLGLFSYLYFFAFLLFDLMYLLVEKYSFSIKIYNINKPMVGR